MKEKLLVNTSAFLQDSCENDNYANKKVKHFKFQLKNFFKSSNVTYKFNLI